MVSIDTQDNHIPLEVRDQTSDVRHLISETTDFRPPISDLRLLPSDLCFMLPCPLFLGS